MQNRPFLKKAALLFLPLLLVVALRLWAVSRQTPHLKNIAVELGSIPQYRVGIFPNHAGTSLLCFKETDKGLGTYFCETATGKTQLLFEEPEQGYQARFRLLGWSSDDGILAFATMSNPDGTNGSGAITICQGGTGAVLARIPADPYARDSQFAWLSTRSFVYSTFSHRSWLVYAENSDGSWGQTQVVKRFVDGRLPSLVGASPHSIAWQKKQEVWTYDFATGAMAKIWEASTNELTGLTQSAVNGNLLLQCKDHTGAFQIELHPPGNGSSEANVVKETRPLPHQPQMELDMSKGRFRFRIRTTLEAEQATFAWDGMLRYYALGGDSLFFTGNPLSEVPGIWQYDTKSKSVRLVASAVHTPLKRTKIIKPAIGFFTNQDGIQISYHLWSPARVLPGKKYPLIIGQALNVWNPFPQIAANAGWFYATTDLTNWINNISTWAEDVTGLCQTLSVNAAIDTNKVFFIAYSAQAGDAHRLIAEKPGMASGVVLFHPAGFSVTGAQINSLLLFGGTDDKGSSADYLVKLQDDAVNTGISVRFLLQEGVQHLTRSIDSEREQAVQLARFLNENK